MYALLRHTGCVLVRKGDWETANLNSYSTRQST